MLQGQLPGGAICHRLVPTKPLDGSGLTVTWLCSTEDVSCGSPQ